MMKLSVSPFQKFMIPVMAISTVACISGWALAASTVSPQGQAPAVVSVGSLDGVINIEFKGAESVDTLRMIAKIGGLSLVADSTVKGTITADLKGLTIKEALDVLSITNGWSWNRIGNTILVGDASRFKDSFQPSTMSIVKLNYAQASDIAGKLNLVIPAGKVQVDARTNTLIITGSDVELAKVKAMVEAMDVPIAVPAPVKPVLNTRIRIQAIGGSTGSYLALLTVDSRNQMMVAEGDRVAEGISVVKIGPGEVRFNYDGNEVAIGTEGSIR